MPDEIYVSTDVEADGPIPGPHSMLRLGSVAFSVDKRVLGEFSVNLSPLPGATEHPRTMTWWAGFPEALAKARENPEDPAVAMPRYVKWLRQLPGRVVFVGQAGCLRLHVGLLVLDALLRRLAVRPLGAGREDLRDGDAEEALS